MTCPSGKRRIATEARAKDDLVRAKFKAAIGNPRRREVRYYLCPQCHGYHLTSQPAPPTKE